MIPHCRLFQGVERLSAGCNGRSARNANRDVLESAFLSGRHVLHLIASDSMEKTGERSMIESANRPFAEVELEEARRYPVVIEWSDEDAVYLAWAPGLRGTTVHGETPVEALEKSTEAVANWIYGMRKVGQPVPAPTTIP